MKTGLIITGSLGLAVLFLVGGLAAVVAMAPKSNTAMPVQRTKEELASEKAEYLVRGYVIGNNGKVVAFASGEVRKSERQYADYAVGGMVRYEFGHKMKTEFWAVDFDQGLKATRVTVGNINFLDNRQERD